MKIKKNITNGEFIYGDFDKDGTLNIDDPKPFDPGVSKYPTHEENPKYYHKARYGDGEREVLLSDELRAIERYNNDKAPHMKTFLKENPGSFGRIKTVPSTMKKLRTRHLDNIKDVAGVTILTTTRRQATTKAWQIKKKYMFDPKETDDYYKNPKGGEYFAHHIGVVSKKNPRLNLEVQVKTKKMFALHKEMHTAYKKGKSSPAHKKKAKKLFKMGF